MVLVVYPDRGLVANGRPNLALFNKLFWIIVCPFILIGLVNFPVISILKGTFPSDSQAGKICLLINSEGSVKGIQINAVFLFLNIFFATYCYLRIRRKISIICPKKRMACIGNYQRNVLSFKETLTVLYFLCFTGLSSVLFRTLAGSSVLHSEQLFWIWNSISFICHEGLHCVLPLFLKIPNNKNTQIPFFVTKDDKLEPRRPENKDEIGQTMIAEIIESRRSFFSNQETKQNCQSRKHLSTASLTSDEKHYKCLKYCKTHQCQT